MAKARLTSQQFDALYSVVKGSVPGHLETRTIPSLVSRGLVTSKRVEGRIPYDKYYLTSNGYEVFEERRTRWYVSKVASVETEYRSDISRAKSLVLN